MKPLRESRRIVKVCSCGRGYTQKGWEKLRLVGRMHVPADEGEPAYELEMRDCVCRSTISREVKP